MTTSLITSTITQTSTTYEVICPITGAGSVIPTQTPGSGPGQGASSILPGGYGPGSGPGGNGISSISQSPSQIPGSGPNGNCPPQQTVTETYTKQVTVIVTAGSGGQTSIPGQPGSGSGPSQAGSSLPGGQGPYTSQSGKAPFPVPSGSSSGSGGHGSGTGAPFPSGTGYYSYPHPSGSGYHTYSHYPSGTAPVLSGTGTPASQFPLPTGLTPPKY